MLLLITQYLLVGDISTASSFCSWLTDINVGMGIPGEVVECVFNVHDSSTLTHETEGEANWSLLFVSTS